MGSAASIPVPRHLAGATLVPLCLPDRALLEHLLCMLDGATLRKPRAVSLGRS